MMGVLIAAALGALALLMAQDALKDPEGEPIPVEVEEEE